MTPAAEKLLRQLGADNPEPEAINLFSGKASCLTCRGTGYAWLMDMRTLQREIGDCPTCKAQRPKLPENSHRTGGKPTRRGFQHYLKP